MQALSTLLLLTAVALSGCASSAYTPGPTNFDQGTQALQRKDYAVAYRFLEQPSPGKESEVLSLMQQSPQMVEAGRLTFAQAALSESIDRYGRVQAFKIEYARLQRYAVYSDASAFKDAAESIAVAFPNELAAYHEQAAERARVAKLPDAEQQTYWAEVFRRSIEASTVRGIIASSQLIDLSRAGTNVGAQLGASLAQAIYIDSASWRSYRATTQIGAGVLGALLGSSIDRAPTVTFQKVYFVRTRSGELRRIEERGSDPILYPVGACVEYREPFHFRITNQKECSQ